MSLVDSHAHLTSDAVYPDVHSILARAKTAGIKKIVNICTNSATLARGLKLRQEYPWIYNAASTTPHDVDKEGETFFPEVVQAGKNGDLIAIGETGLDYYYKHSSIEEQKTYLRRYLELALELNLPIIIHCREAFADLFEIVDRTYKINGKHAPGVLHCFTGSELEAEEVLKRGWYLSLSGIVTFKKSLVLQAVAKMTPLEQLLIETDTPYLAPQSHRGTLNEPAYICETAAKIASLKNITSEEVAKVTSANAQKLFRFDSKQMIS